MKTKWNLFLSGALVLLLELTLIRYLGAEILNMGYFPNLVLIAAFLGIGLGFIAASGSTPGDSAHLLSWLPGVLLILVVYIHFAQPSVPGFSAGHGEVGNELYFTDIPDRSPSIFAFGVCFALITLGFSILGHRMALLLVEVPSLVGYSYEVAGSICGVLCFTLLSHLEQPAWVWFALLLLVYCLLAPTGLTKEHLSSSWPLLLAVALVARSDFTYVHPQHGRSGSFERRWSPYQRVDCALRVSDGLGAIFVNGIRHQTLLSSNLVGSGFYDRPYLARKESGAANYKKVLIIGAGAGNDVAAALVRGAVEIDAVEIDPTIARFGKNFHPAKAYDDARVTLHVTDGRAFLKDCNKSYDLIVFALTDSIVRASPLSQLRLENYLFTHEAMASAWASLNAGGDLVMYNSYREPWLQERIAKLMECGLGIAPSVLVRDFDFTMFCARRETSADRATRHEGIDCTSLPSDDWPFLYLRARAVPGFYLAGGLIFVLFVLSLAMVANQIGAPACSQPTAARLAFLLMGAGFALMQTKSIVQFSLLFGTTWKNHSIVFVSVLVMVLIANWVVSRVKNTKLAGFAIFALVALCLLNIGVPMKEYLRIQFSPLRAGVAIVVTFLPMFFANVAFGSLFRAPRTPVTLFGWNMLGASIGSVLEYAAMLLGYGALNWLVIMLYTSALLSAWVAFRGSESQGNQVPRCFQWLG